MKKIIIFLIILLSFPLFSFARENVDYWYIKDFKTSIRLNKNSTARIVEEITADCGRAVGKHGIFRILPTKLKTEEEEYSIPIELISITDFKGNPLNYQTINSSDTITWKIGDPNKTVQGINNYKIEYIASNVFRTQNPGFDEFYWNLLGSFWDLEIDSFSAEIIFPQGINKDNTEIEYYTGYLNEKGESLAKYRWKNKNILLVESTQTIEKNKGITLSASFPKNIIIPYKFSLWEKYGRFLWFLVPLSALILCFYLWKKHGKEFETKKTIVPEFEIPENMHPVEMGLVYNNGFFETQLVTSSIIHMAVKGSIKIEESTRKRLFFFEKKDYILKRTGKEPKNEYDKIVFNRIFNTKKEIKVSDLKKRNNALDIKKLKKDIIYIFHQKGLITKKGKTFLILFITIGAAVIFISFYLFAISTRFFSLLGSGLIIIFFALFMPKRTKRGAELFWRIKGFKLYMKTAEKYRQQFYEKENIFDKLLPYAIVFNMTKEWAKKMEKIYAKEYYKNYAPAWYVGAVGSFDANSFVSSISSISNSISSSVSSGTGAGGAGGAGGGAGGGGGGGW